jgi:hypothetical protein
VSELKRWAKKDTVNENEILADPLFWGRVAGAVTGSLSAAPEKDLRRHWIDDMIPEVFKRTNEALCVEGVAHLMGNPNGRFGEYRFCALVSWPLVRHPERQMVIAALHLDHDREQLSLTVSALS